ncbi:MAG: phosphotransferase [Verrucomicrobiales bacterium]
MEKEELDTFILEITHAESLYDMGVVQSLWSGYGNIVRIGLKGANYPSVIVKHVKPDNGNHPRGWNTDLSHERKLKSYQVETNWYQSSISNGIDKFARIPKCLGVKNHENDFLVVMEDLDHSGFQKRKSFVNKNELESCIRWLAKFHAYFMGEGSNGLWETGTYWHLETRPDELEQLDDLNLKKAASAIDAKLKNSTFQTLVHGDAKLANFCFNNDGTKVAAVDFQYVGGGCGMKDLAYFVGSCFRDKEAEDREIEVLDFYFEALADCMKFLKKDQNLEELIEDWRPLYRVAWADFHRFMKGWSPGHWKLSDYSERVTQEVINTLKEELN